MTPGQAAYEAWNAHLQFRTTVAWDTLRPGSREAWEAAAQAAIAAAPPVIVKFDGKLSETDVAELREKFREAVRNEQPRVIP